MHFRASSRGGLEPSPMHVLRVVLVLLKNSLTTCRMWYIECIYDFFFVFDRIGRRRKDDQDGSKYRKIINYSCDCESTTEEYPVTQMFFLCEKTFHGKCVLRSTANIIGMSLMTSKKFWDFWSPPLLTVWITRATYHYPCVLLGHP